MKREMLITSISTSKQRVHGMFETLCSKNILKIAIAEPRSSTLLKIPPYNTVQYKVAFTIMCEVTKGQESEN